MSESILRAELKRIKQIERVLEKNCPVCRASCKIKKRPYKPTNCGLFTNDTACSPAIQKRCKKIMKLSDRLEWALFEARLDIEEEMINYE